MATVHSKKRVFPLPTISRYAGENTNATQVTVGSLTIWYSYTTPVGFLREGKYAFVSENVWTKTTGRHLNAIPGDKQIVDNDTFNQLLIDELS